MLGSLVSVCSLCLPNREARAQGLFQYDYEITNMGPDINSSANDYAPALSRDGNFFYFTSYRKDGSTGEADVFAAPRSGDAWGRVFNPGEPLNSRDNEGSVAILNEGQAMVFAADNRPDDVGDTDLYIGMSIDGRIERVKNLGESVNSDDWDAQPTITADGSMLYFASDRSGGYGGTDIWSVRAIGKEQDGTPIWGEPENLGPHVNSEQDERSPYITGDGGTLYFASDGHESFGKFDLFVSYFSIGEWTQPINLGPSINSPEDEMFFFAPEREDIPFYFTSSRGGGAGKLDIYQGTPNVFGNGLFHLTVNVTDSADRPVPGIVIITDSESGDTVATVITSIGQLDYEQHLPAGRKYRISASVPNRAPLLAETAAAIPGETRRVRLLCSTFTGTEFDLATYNIPYFIPGYYRLNTSINLERLFPLREGTLRKATYIEQFSFGSRQHRQYKAYSRVIDQVVQTVYERGAEEIFARFVATSSPDETLEIQITGFSDPQPFVGTYYESETARFLDSNGTEHTVKQGQTITNLELSGLRAWFTAQYVDRLFLLGTANGHPEYQQLKEAGRIRMKIVGEGVDAEQNNYETQRRISIRIMRAGGESEFDLNTAFLK